MNLFLLTILLFFYYMGCQKTWQLLLEARQETTPLTVMERITMIIIVPFSWLSYFSLYLVILNDTMRNDKNKL